MTIVTYGTLVQNVIDAAALLEQRGIHATVLRLMSVAPLPVAQLLEQMSETPHVVVVEEVSGNCAISQSLAWELKQRRSDIRVDGIDLGCGYVPHGSVDELYAHYGLDAQGIASFVQEVHQSEN